jgi:hypothetical protein
MCRKLIFPVLSAFREKLLEVLQQAGLDPMVPPEVDQKAG